MPLCPEVSGSSPHAPNLHFSLIKIHEYSATILENHFMTSVREKPKPCKCKAKSHRTYDAEITVLIIFIGPRKTSHCRYGNVINSLFLAIFITS